MTRRTGPAGFSLGRAGEAAGGRGAEGRGAADYSSLQAGRDRKTWYGDKTPRTPTENRIHLF